MRLASSNSNIHVNVSWLKELKKLTKNRKTLILAPKVIVERYELNKLLSHKQNGSGIELFIVPNGEEQKSFATYKRALEICGDLKLGRDGLIVGIGGGATTDLAGFVAATWLRGVEWCAFPTTVAGMVDAAIGGKTGINSRHGKNLVGAFYAPSEVVIDLAFLKTLAQRDINAGLAEVAKCGFISDPSILKDLSRSSEVTPALIAKAIKVKVKVVAKDFKESFGREILNYGHTLGHAIEKHSKYSLRHGEAVAIGMVFAAELSHITDNLSKSIVDQHRQILTKLSLPTSYHLNAYSELLEIMSGDKKVKSGRLRFVTLTAIGKTNRAEKVSPRVLKRAYERISK